MIPLIQDTPLKIEWVRQWVRFSHIESLKSRLTGKPINEIADNFQGHLNFINQASSTMFILEGEFQWTDELMERKFELENFNMMTRIPS